MVKMKTDNDGFNVRHKHIKRNAHGDDRVIYDIVVIVGFSPACALSEIGFRASEGRVF